MIKTLFLDLGNVLLFFSFERMFRQVSAFCGMEEKKIIQLLFHLHEPYERGVIDSKTMHERFCKVVGKEVDYEGLMTAVSDIFEPNHELIALLKEIKSEGIKLALLSNTCEAHFEFAKNHYPFLRDSFDHFVLSYELGQRKPEPLIYQSALKIAGSIGEESFFTDDLLENILAAREEGIDAEVFTTNEQFLSQLKERNILVGA